MVERTEELLEITQLEEEAFSTKGRRLMMEGVPVSPETAPYLVSGASRRVLWVRQPRERVSAAFRYGETRREFYPSIVEAVEKEGKKRGWGNVLPFSEEGLQGAVSHLLYYGIKPVEVFVSPHGPELIAEGEYGGYRVLKASWLLPGYAVIIPENRAYLGSAIVLSGECFAVILHNPSRGMAVLRDLDPEEEMETDLEKKAQKKQTQKKQAQEKQTPEEMDPDEEVVK